MNIIQIAGHLGTNPETRVTPSGQKVTTFSVAVNVRKGGQDVTIWYRITIWGDRFDKMIQYLKKGSAVIVVGTLQKPEIYTDKEGRPQVSLEITAEMLQFSPFGKGDRSDEQQGQMRTTTPAAASYGSTQGYGNANTMSNPSYDDFGGSGYRFDNVGTKGHSDEDEMPF